LVLRRTPLPSGDVVATLLSPGGTWRAVARKGRLPGGNLARLSLFHDVTVQFWRRNDDDLALITQVQLNGALDRLARPEAYPYAHLLAELADVLTVEHPVDERFYTLVASGLRGLHGHDDTEAVGLAYAWRLLGLAGVAPDVRACASCGGVPSYLNVAEGNAHCAACHAAVTPGGAAAGAAGDALAGPRVAGPRVAGPRVAGPILAGPRLANPRVAGPRFAGGDPGGPLLLGEGAMAELDGLVRGPLSAAVHAPPRERAPHWRALRRFVHWHVGEVRALATLPC
jgi:DNA repair protein RecO